MNLQSRQPVPLTSLQSPPRKSPRAKRGREKERGERENLLCKRETTPYCTYVRGVRRFCPHRRQQERATRANYSCHCTFVRFSTAAKQHSFPTQPPCCLISGGGEECSTPWIVRLSAAARYNLIHCRLLPRGPRWDGGCGGRRCCGKNNYRTSMYIQMGRHTG
ncbi:unnamed protein product [Ectocarpus sp. 12 AP-2014]